MIAALLLAAMLRSSNVGTYFFTLPAWMPQSVDAVNTPGSDSWFVDGAAPARRTDERTLASVIAAFAGYYERMFILHEPLDNTNTVRDLKTVPLHDLIRASTNGFECWEYQPTNRTVVSRRFVEYDNLRPLSNWMAARWIAGGAGRWFPTALGGDSPEFPAIDNWTDDPFSGPNSNVWTQACRSVYDLAPSGTVLGVSMFGASVRTNNVSVAYEAFFNGAISDTNVLAKLDRVKFSQPLGYTYEEMATQVFAHAVVTNLLHPTRRLNPLCLAAVGQSLGLLDRSITVAGDAFAATNVAESVDGFCACEAAVSNLTITVEDDMIRLKAEDLSNAVAHASWMLVSNDVFRWSAVTTVVDSTIEYHTGGMPGRIAPTVLARVSKGSVATELTEDAFMSALARSVSLRPNETARVEYVETEVRDSSIGLRFDVYRDYELFPERFSLFVATPGEQGLTLSMEFFVKRNLTMTRPVGIGPSSNKLVRLPPGSLGVKYLKGGKAKINTVLTALQTVGTTNSVQFKSSRSMVDVGGGHSVTNLGQVLAASRKKATEDLSELFSAAAGYGPESAENMVRFNSEDIGRVNSFLRDLRYAGPDIEIKGVSLMMAAIVVGTEGGSPSLVQLSWELPGTTISGFEFPVPVGINHAFDMSHLGEIDFGSGHPNVTVRTSPKIVSDCQWDWDCLYRFP